MPRNVAICVGQNNYSPSSGIPPLRGCVNDGLLIGSMLTRAGFDVRQIQDQNATQRGILSALETAVAGQRDGDYLVFWNSSHGYQIRDQSGDELFDFQDEAICSYDTDPRDPLTDDKFQQILSRANPNAMIFLGTDSCHSKTMTRQLIESLLKSADSATDARDVFQDQYKQQLGRNLTRRLPTQRDLGDVSPTDDLEIGRDRQARLWIPPDDIVARAEPLLDLNEYVPSARDIDLEEYSKANIPIRRFGGLSRDLDESKMQHLLLSGCLANEVSWDAQFTQRYHGAMTYYFATAVLRAWAAGRAMTYKEAWEAASQGLLDGGYNQHPGLEGPDRLKNLPVFGYAPGSTPSTPIGPSEPAANDHVQQLAADIRRRLQQDAWFILRFRSDPNRALLEQGIPSELVPLVLQAARARAE